MIHENRRIVHHVNITNARLHAAVPSNQAPYRGVEQARQADQPGNQLGAQAGLDVLRGDPDGSLVKLQRQPPRARVQAEGEVLRVREDREMTSLRNIRCEQ
jgi:hypothetical protein